MSADVATARVLLDVALIVVLAHAMGSLFGRIGQPPVIGEIVAGIMLGPTLLGALPGDPTGALLPPEAREALRTVGQLALALFMFSVGWSLDIRALRRHGRTAATISVASACVPFCLGAGLALVLHRAHGVVNGEPVPLLPFALFIGASMAITAFPVLARILVDRGMHRGPLGALVLACAAVDDVLGWMLVVVVLAVLSSAGALEWLRILAALALFVIALRVLVAPAVARALRAAGRGSPGAMTLIVAGALACAAATELIGVHFVLGAFAFGVLLPRDAACVQVVDDTRHRIAPVVVLLLPVYFVLPGLNVDVGSLTTTDLAELAAVVLVACGGKLGGAVAAARLRGWAWRDALTIGSLMNARGLIELVVLSIGFERGVLDGRLFTVMVLMAIATTVLTGPLLNVVQARGRAREPRSAVRLRRSAQPGGARVSPTRRGA